MSNLPAIITQVKPKLQDADFFLSIILTYPATCNEEFAEDLRVCKAISNNDVLCDYINDLLVIIDQTECECFICNMIREGQK